MYNPKVNKIESLKNDTYQFQKGKTQKKWNTFDFHRCIAVLAFLMTFLIIYLMYRVVYVQYNGQTGFNSHVISHLMDFVNSNNSVPQRKKGSIECFDEIIIDGIIDILDDDDQPPPKGKSIFFHETSCGFGNGNTLALTPRQACAVESAAKMNPNKSIYLLYASPIKFANESLSPRINDRIINELFKYDNIRIRRVDLNRYTKNTPLEEWYKKRHLQKSAFPTSHASDVLRYLSLWRYGGTYLDLDVVIMSNLESLGNNYAAAESDQDVAAGILNFDYQGFGHDVADICIKDLRDHFRGKDWGYNGPGVITRALQKICSEKKVKSMSIDKCKGFNVLPPSSFYPISWQEWSLYFDPKKIQKALDKTKSSYGIHVWNKLSGDSTISKNKPEVLYSLVAKKFCPNVFRESEDYF